MAAERSDDMDVDYATAVADRANRLMSEQSVPATPINYNVWFNYALGASPALRKTIDVLVSNKRKFDASINHELYATFVGTLSETFSTGDVPDQLNGVIDSAKQFLAAAISDNRTQIAALGDVSAQVKTTGDPRHIIEKLVAELSKATAQATALEANFTETSRQLENVQNSLQEAEKRSNTDALTGLANRRSLEQFLRAAQIKAMETGEPLGVFMIDIDHFKKFNDNHGHQIGDQVLRLVAKVLQDGVRDGDLAARYGGEELIAVLPGADLSTSKNVAERIRHRIAEARLTRRTTGKEIGSITVSIGVAQFRLSESAEAMIERCDRGLYHAKRCGRNRTVAENEIEAEVGVN
jgi:diguanylate cyclase